MKQINEFVSWARKRDGRGYPAMFSGPSGSGMTLAARALAKQLGLELHRVDLSLVVGGIEVSCLLQRIENYNGLVILKTHKRENVDPEFPRRLRAIINFTE